MIDPRRLADEDGPGSALLRAAQGEIPPQRVLERTLAAVAAGAATSLVSGGVAAKATAKTGSAAIVKFLLIGFASGAVTVGSAAAIHHRITKTPEEAPAKSVLQVSTKTTPETPARPPLGPSRAGTEGTEREQPPTTVPRSVPGRAPERPISRRVEALPAPGFALPSATQSFGADSAMSVEVRLLDDARRALGEGRASDALAALGRYAREAPSRRLAPEAAYLEMEANRARGDRAATMRSAEVLLNTYPDGPHAARARRILRGE
jgi:hypothetical protein